MNQPQSISRTLVAALALSTAGFGAWVASEGFSPAPYIPTKGDVATIGHGSTRYETGVPVKLTDPPITHERAEQLARNLLSKDEQRFRATLPKVRLYQDEYDLYLDFVGQFGIGNWSASSMRKHLLVEQYRQSCDALLMWRYQNKRDCKLPKNWGPKGCKGVWTRQQTRHEKCMAVQE